MSNDDDLLDVRNSPSRTYRLEYQERLLIGYWWVISFYFMGFVGIVKRIGFEFGWLESITGKFVFPFWMTSSVILLICIVVESLPDIWQKVKRIKNIWQRYRKRKEDAFAGTTSNGDGCLGDDCVLDAPGKQCARVWGETRLDDYLLDAENSPKTASRSTRGVGKKIQIIPYIIITVVFIVFWTIAVLGIVKRAESKSRSSGVVTSQFLDLVEKKECANE